MDVNATNVGAKVEVVCVCVCERKENPHHLSNTNPLEDGLSHNTASRSPTRSTCRNIYQCVNVDQSISANQRVWAPCYQKIANLVCSK